MQRLCVCARLCSGPLRKSDGVFCHESFAVGSSVAAVWSYCCSTLSPWSHSRKQQPRWSRCLPFSFYEVQRMTEPWGGWWWWWCSSVHPTWEYYLKYEKFRRIPDFFIGFEHFTGKTSTSAQQNIQIGWLIIAFAFSKLMRTFPVGQGASFSPELVMSHGRINPEHCFLPYYDGKQFKSHQHPAGFMFYRS